MPATDAQMTQKEQVNAGNDKGNMAGGKWQI